jgi:hypothetical protein
MYMRLYVNFAPGLQYSTIVESGREVGLVGGCRGGDTARGRASILGYSEAVPRFSTFYSHSQGKTLSQASTNRPNAS